MNQDELAFSLIEARITESRAKARRETVLIAANVALSATFLYMAGAVLFGGLL